MRSVAMKGGRSSWLVWQVAFLVIVFVGIAYLFWGISIKDVLPALSSDATPEMKKLHASLEKRIHELDDREARLEKLESQFRMKEQKFREMQAGASAAGTVPNKDGCCTVS